MIFLFLDPRDDAERTDAADDNTLVLGDDSGTFGPSLLLYPKRLADRTSKEFTRRSAIPSSIPLTAVNNAVFAGVSLGESLWFTERVAKAVVWAFLVGLVGEAATSGADMK